MNFFDIVKVVLLGIIEGITEWLPISSTGHLMLFQGFFQFESLSADYVEMFNVVIQLGAILAVVTLYFKKLNPFSPSKNVVEKKNTWILWGKVLVACLPAAVIGILLDDWLDEHLYNVYVVSLMLILYGVLFILVENRNKNKTFAISDMGQLTYKTALIIGLFQLLSLIPGTSRSGATIIGAMLIGCSRYIAAEFTFYLAIPVMFGASLLKILKYLARGNAFGLSEVGVLLLGAVVAYVVSILAIKFLMQFIKKHDFKPFGYYRIVLGIICLLVFTLSSL